MPTPTETPTPRCDAAKIVRNETMYDGSGFYGQPTAYVRFEKAQEFERQLMEAMKALQIAHGYIDGDGTNLDDAAEAVSKALAAMQQKEGK